MPLVDPTLRERVLELDAADLLTSPRPETLDALWSGRCVAVRVRGAYATEDVARIVRDIEAGRLAVPYNERDHHDSGRRQIRTLGVPISPSDTYPAGPDPEPYFTAAEPFARAAAELFAPAPSFPDRVAPLLQALAGTPVELARDAAGRTYGELTLRHIPEGCGLTPHCENLYMQIPIYDGVRERLDLTRKLGYFVVLRKPPAGGELVLYETTHKPGPFPFPARDLEVDATRPHVQVPTAPGDLMIIPAGPRYHQITGVIRGDRWTAGGFGAPTRDGSRFLRWA